MSGDHQSIHPHAVCRSVDSHHSLVTWSSLFSSTFGMVDSEEVCIVVMVYNTADSWGVLIGDSVVIPEPQVKRHSITHKDKVSVSCMHLNIILNTI